MLSEFYTRGRDNNFNLLRLTAALLVLYSHSFPLSDGESTQVELVTYLLGRDSGGAVAVDAFFLMSGFLISGSMLSSQNLWIYLRSRALRIFPALAASVLLCAFAIGPLVTTLNPRDYFADHETWRFLWINMSLVQSSFALPGVFVELPNTSPNGSLWTLPNEARMYVAVAALWAIGVLGRPKLLLAVIIAATGLALSRPGLAELLFFQPLGPRCGVFFAIGMLTMAFRSHIRIHGGIAAGLIALAVATRGTPQFVVAYGAALSYGLLWLAYVPDFRWFNRIGDYSYGIYIFAFPIQQTLVWALPPLKPLELFVAALPPTLLFAILSWHFIEKPALAFARPRRVTRDHGTRVVAEAPISPSNVTASTGAE